MSTYRVTCGGSAIGDRLPTFAAAKASLLSRAGAGLHAGRRTTEVAIERHGAERPVVVASATLRGNDDWDATEARIAAMAECAS